MTLDAHPDDEPHRIGRRALLRTGGLTLSLAAVLAACKKKPKPDPGRVGFAPTPTDLPQVVVDDGVRLRTVTSIEYMLISVYGTITKSGALKPPDQQLVDRLVTDHQAAADALAKLTTAAGAEPYECANSWYMNRVVPPIFTAINGDKATGVPPTDNPARDYLATVNAMESMAGAMYQNFVETLASQDLRAEFMRFGAASGRHAAVSAIHSTGAPEAYVNPFVVGRDPTEPKDGLIPLYSITTEFGSLAPVQLVIGAESSAGTRTTLAIDTPAENSFVYAGETCPAP
jgi:hypothetical protein